MQEMAASPVLMQESATLFQNVVLKHHETDTLEALTAELQSVQAGAHFPTQGPHFDTSTEVAGKRFVGIAHAAYTAALQELILSRQQPIPAQPAAAPGVLSAESALLQQLLTAIQSLQGHVGVPVNALPLPVSQQQPPPAPLQGPPLGSGVLLPSLRLTSSMTFEDFYRSCGAALENYNKLPSGSQEKSRARKQVSKRRVVYDWINRCLLQENGWELAAALEFMELARRGVMSAGKAMPLGLYVETVGRAVHLRENQFGGGDW
jgi:hypothetical protein